MLHAEFRFLSYQVLHFSFPSRMAKLSVALIFALFAALFIFSEASPLQQPEAKGVRIFENYFQCFKTAFKCVQKLLKALKGTKSNQKEPKLTINGQK